MNLILSFDEMRILLYNIGFRQIDGILMEEKVFSGEEVLLAMKHLYENGLICAGEEAFFIREDVRAALEVIGNPDKVLKMRGKTGKPSYACYYSEEMAVVTQMYEKRKEAIRIMTFTVSEYQEWREENIDYCEHRDPDAWEEYGFSGG